MLPVTVNYFKKSIKVVKEKTQVANEAVRNLVLRTFGRLYVEYCFYTERKIDQGALNRRLTKLGFENLTNIDKTSYILALEAFLTSDQSTKDKKEVISASRKLCLQEKWKDVYLYTLDSRLSLLGEKAKTIKVANKFFNDTPGINNAMSKEELIKYYQNHIKDVDISSNPNSAIPSNADVIKAGMKNVFKSRNWSTADLDVRIADSTNSEDEYTQSLNVFSKAKIYLQRLVYTSLFYSINEESYTEALKVLKKKGFEDQNPSKTTIDSMYTGLVSVFQDSIDKSEDKDDIGPGASVANDLFREKIRSYKRSIKIIYLYREWDLSDIPEIPDDGQRPPIDDVDID